MLIMAAINVQVEKPENWSRLKLILRPLFMIIPILKLIIPMIIAAIYNILAWFAILFTGKFPDNMWEHNKKTFEKITRLQGFSSFLTDEPSIDD